MSLKKSKIMLADGFPTLPDFDNMETGEATKEDIYATQGIIAHVQKTLKADGAYSAGDQFVYNDVLYTVTGSIASGANIVLTGAGANAEISDNIVTQISNINADIFSSRELILSEAFSKADFDASNYVASHQLLSEEIAAVLGSNTVLFQVYYKGDSGKHSAIVSDIISVYDATHVGSNEGWCQLRTCYVYFTGKILNSYIQGDFQAMSLSANITSDFYADMGSSNEFLIKIYKLD